MPSHLSSTSIHGFACSLSRSLACAFVLIRRLCHRHRRRCCHALLRLGDPLRVETNQLNRTDGVSIYQRAPVEARMSWNRQGRWAKQVMSDGRANRRRLPVHCCRIGGGDGHDSKSSNSGAGRNWGSGPQRKRKGPMLLLLRLPSPQQHTVTSTPLAPNAL